VISESRKYGVQLILGLVNNWNALGGKHKYVQWARERGQYVKSDDDFFTHPVVKQYYKNHVKVRYHTFFLVLGIILLFFFYQRYHTSLIPYILN
jgi:endo-1,4-beta-mannosidase